MTKQQIIATLIVSLVGGWRIYPRGTGVRFKHDGNSRGCRTLCVFLFCKGCGF
jgi:hypothetical protein